MFLSASSAKSVVGIGSGRFLVLQDRYQSHGKQQSIALRCQTGAARSPTTNTYTILLASTLQEHCTRLAERANAGDAIAEDLLGQGDAIKKRRVRCPRNKSCVRMSSPCRSCEMSPVQRGRIPMRLNGFAMFAAAGAAALPARAFGSR